jgi:hypothetical protein
MNEELKKLASILELGNMTKDELINYIDKLHSVLMTYQNLIDGVVRQNRDIKR